MADRGDPLVDVEIIGEDFFLTRRRALWNFDRLHRMRERMRDLSRPVDRALEAEHPVDDVDVGEEVRDRPRVRFALDAIEEKHRTAIEMFLQAGDLEVGIDFDTGRQHITLSIEELERLAQ